MKELRRRQAEAAGRPIEGKDAKADKTTYVKLFGLGVSREMADKETNAALAVLADLPGNKSFLNSLVQEMAARTN